MLFQNKLKVTLSAFFFAYLLAISSLAYSASNEIKIITCECPPLSYNLDGKPSGPSVDIVKEIQKKLGTNEKIHIFPWARGYRMLQTKPNILLFSTTRTSDREYKYKWIGPIVEKRFSFYAKKSSHIKLTNLENAKIFSIGVVRGSNNENFLLSKDFKNVHSYVNEKKNLQLLQFDRIDLWYTDNAQFTNLVSKSSIKDQVEEVFIVNKSKSYYALSMKTPEGTVKKWKNAFNDLRKDGTVMQILKKYKLESLYASYDR